MDQVGVIRLLVLSKGKSQREVAKDMGISRNTVKKYLGQSEPIRRATVVRGTPVLDGVRERIDCLLGEWKSRTTAKQRVTGTRLHQELVEEGYEIGVTTVRQYLRKRRLEQAEVYVPLVHRPGDSAQVDFFEVTVDVQGQRRKAWKFVVRSMYSKRDFVWIYDRCDQVSFLDGHVRCFAYFGGVPQRMVYDNLTAAVKTRVGHRRELSERFAALASHYNFEPCFARVGEGHDKGGVECRGKAIRLRHLTPIPNGQSLEELSVELQRAIDAWAQNNKPPEGQSVMDRFEIDCLEFLALPPTAFEAACVRPGVCVSSKATVRVENAFYSVPCHWARTTVTAYIGVDTVRVVQGGHSVTHPKMQAGQSSIRYSHYLPELARKPQALRQVAPELLAELGAPFSLFWSRLNEQMEPLDAARCMSNVVRMIVEHGQDKVRRVLERMLADGRLDSLALGSILRVADERPESHVPQSLQHYEVESACAADFDHLLQGGL